MAGCSTDVDGVNCCGKFCMAFTAARAALVAISLMACSMLRDTIDWIWESCASFKRPGSFCSTVDLVEVPGFVLSEACCCRREINVAFRPVVERPFSSHLRRKSSIVTSLSASVLLLLRTGGIAISMCAPPPLPLHFPLNFQKNNAKIKINFIMWSCKILSLCH